MSSIEVLGNRGRCRLKKTWSWVEEAGLLPLAITPLLPITLEDRDLDVDFDTVEVPFNEYLSFCFY